MCFLEQTVWTVCRGGGDCAFGAQPQRGDGRRHLGDRGDLWRGLCGGHGELGPGNHRQRAETGVCKVGHFYKISKQVFWEWVILQKTKTGFLRVDYFTENQDRFSESGLFYRKPRPFFMILNETLNDSKWWSVFFKIICYISGLSSLL